MLTAKDDDMDKIMGLEFGADDYMTKPFNMLELKARIKTIFRRMEKARKIARIADHQAAQHDGEPGEQKRDDDTRCR